MKTTKYNLRDHKDRVRLLDSFIKMHMTMLQKPGTFWSYDRFYEIKDYHKNHKAALLKRFDEREEYRDSIEQYEMSIQFMKDELFSDEEMSGATWGMNK